MLFYISPQSVTKDICKMTVRRKKNEIILYCSRSHYLHMFQSIQLLKGTLDNNGHMQQYT